MKRLVLGLLFLVTSVGYSADTFESLVGNVPVANVTGDTIQVPFLTWGGDVPTFYANGGLITTPQSIFGKMGLKLKLVNGDDFTQQARDFVSGKSGLMRGTFHQMALASELINKDPRTKPVMFLQLTWSLGDHIVGREHIHNLNDLKGKKICLQQGGPHIGLVDDSLKAAGLTWSDIKVVWVKDLNGKNGPAETFRKDTSIDACCVISPDMVGLTSGLEAVGNGGESTVKGAHVVNSTSSMSRSIADVYIVRNDYYVAHKDTIEKFLVGYLKGTEELLKAKDAYNNGRGQSPTYIDALKMAQQIYGKDAEGAMVLPTIEEDAHGLVSDANFVRVPGNEIFFTDPNNLTGFESRQKATIDLAFDLGYVKHKLGFAKADWDYKKISAAVGVPYVAPVYSTGRIKAEVSDFGADLDTNEIVHFEIKFKSGQDEFPVSEYSSEFLRFVNSAATFSNAAIVIEGHADPTLALRDFFWAAQAKGLVTGDAGNYQFKGKPLNLADVDFVISTVQSEQLSGFSRRDKNGQTMAIPDPKTTVAAAKTLSDARCKAVRRAIEEFAKTNKLQIDMSQALVDGVGIAKPVNPRPRDMKQAEENMRVVFRVIKVKAEAISPNDFDFDK